MKKQITSCLWFNGNGQDAARFYCKAFRNAKITAESPIVTEFEVAGQRFICLNGGPQYTPNPSISFYYHCENEAELDALWREFKKDGMIMIPLEEYPWGKKYGFLQDRFGISWQFGLKTPDEAMQGITPSLLFVGAQHGHAKEAINHYASIFPDFKLNDIVYFGANESPDIEGTVKHARFSIGDQEFMALDSIQPQTFKFNEGISFTIYCETQEEIDHYWYKLTEGGAESMCGWLKDRFGVSWQVIPTILAELMSDPAKAGKTAKAFMEMRKFNIEQLISAAI